MLLIRLEMTGETILPPSSGAPPPAALSATPSRLNSAGHALLPETPSSLDASLASKARASAPTSASAYTTPAGSSDLNGAAAPAAPLAPSMRQQPARPGPAAATVSLERHAGDPLEQAEAEAEAEAAAKAEAVAKVEAEVKAELEAETDVEGVGGRGRLRRKG